MSTGGTMSFEEKSKPIEVEVVQPDGKVKIALLQLDQRLHKTQFVHLTTMHNILLMRESDKSDDLHISDNPQINSDFLWKISERTNSKNKLLGYDITRVK